MRRAAAFWRHWAERSAPPHVLAIFRIAFGAFLLLYWGLNLPHVPVLYSQEGLVIPILDRGLPDVVQLLLVPPPAAVAWLIFSVFLLALLGLTVGAWARVCAAVAAILYAYYWGISLHLFPSSYDRLFAFLLVILAFSPSDATLSVRAWRKWGTPLAWEEIPVFPQRLIALQIAATYLGVGWQKLVLPDWQGGEMLSYSLISNWGTAPAFALVRQNLPLAVYDAGTFLVKAFELSIPFGLFVRRWQWAFFAMGAIFHLSIAILLAIWWFLVLIPAYIVYLEPEDILAWLRRRFPAIPDVPGPPPVLRPRSLHLGRRSLASRGVH